jgi:hypothetical protein
MRELETGRLHIVSHADASFLTDEAERRYRDDRPRRSLECEWHIQPLRGRYRLGMQLSQLLGKPHCAGEGMAR